LLAMQGRRNSTGVGSEREQMKHICNFSGGICSFWAAHRTIQAHGALNTVLLFADTLIESPQLYEFNQCASGVLGVPITRVSREETPWELFRREGLIGNNRFPICSVRLKREPLNNWMESNLEMDSRQDNFLLEAGTVVLGFDWSEHHRVTEFQEAHPTWRVSAPMTSEPIWDKCKMQREAEKIGLPISDNYKFGFSHDNCGGGCVRAGQAHWARLLEVKPETYDYWEREEFATMEELRRREIVPMTILKDRRGGHTRELSLREFRHRVEAGEEFDRHDWGGCGCGGATISKPSEEPTTP